jgi:hypothetical protein
MEYRHYWSAERAHSDYATAWPRLLEDTRVIIDAVRSTGTVIAGPSGFYRPILDAAEGIAFNGDATTDLAADTFYLAPPEPVPDRAWLHCDTGRCPYDLAVAAVLLRCRLLLPGVFLLGSDGGWDDGWLGARRLVGELFGSTPPGSVLHPVPGPGGEG